MIKTKRSDVYLSLAILVLSVAWLLPLAAQGPAAGPPTSQVPITQVPGTPPTVAPGQPSQPAVTVTTAQSPAAPDHPIEQIEYGLAASLFLQWLKKKRWLTFLTPDATAQIQAICGFVVAFATAAGIHFAVTGSVLADSGAAITISGISWDAIKDVGFQWVSQQGWYLAVVKEAKA